MRFAPEPSASRLHGRNDLVDIVANDAEAHILRVLFNHFFIIIVNFDSRDSSSRRTSSQCRLSRLCHHVGLVENDELESRAVMNG